MTTAAEDFGGRRVFRFGLDGLEKGLRGLKRFLGPRKGCEQDRVYLVCSGFHGSRGQRREFETYFLCCFAGGGGGGGRGGCLLGDAFSWAAWVVLDRRWEMVARVSRLKKPKICQALNPHPKPESVNPKTQSP